MPAAVTFMVVARASVVLLPRIGARPQILAGSACLLTGFVWLSRAGADSGYLLGVLGPTLLIAIGIGLTFPTLMAVATADAPDGDAGIVGGLAGTANQVGGAIGLAIFATVVGADAAYGPVFLAAAGIAAVIAVVASTVMKSTEWERIS